MDLLGDNPDIGGKLISKIFISYLTEIKSKVMVAKRKACEELKSRMDHNLVQSSNEKPININEMMKSAKERIGNDNDQKLQE